MGKYAYLDHVEAEFVIDGEEYRTEADRLLKKFFQRRKGAQSRAFMDDSLRYIVFPDGEDVKIIEEEGDWELGDIEPVEENVYELIAEENGRIRQEEVSAREAEAYIL